MEKAVRPLGCWRTTNDPKSAMAGLFLKSKDNALAWKSRVLGKSPKQGAKVFSGGTALVQKPPLWLKMVRLGENFAVYKSRDGWLWTLISNVSGGPIALESTFELGLFVSGSEDGKPAKAKFDSITIGPPRMRYKTSWVGNTFGSRNEDGHVSNGLKAMWVGADGVCYTSAYWDEGERTGEFLPRGKIGEAAAN